jgi:hypothetical protein
MLPSIKLAAAAAAAAAASATAEAYQFQGPSACCLAAVRLRPHISLLQPWHQLRKRGMDSAVLPERTCTKGKWHI